MLSQDLTEAAMWRGGPGEGAPVAGAVKLLGEPPKPWSLGDAQWWLGFAAHRVVRLLAGRKAQRQNILMLLDQARADEIEITRLKAEIALLKAHPAKLIGRQHQWDALSDCCGLCGVGRYHIDYNVAHPQNCAPITDMAFVADGMFHDGKLYRITVETGKEPVVELVGIVRDLD
jgi:hypothetical protein